MSSLTTITILHTAAGAEPPVTGPQQKLKRGSNSLQAPTAQLEPGTSVKHAAP